MKKGVPTEQKLKCKIHHHRTLVPIFPFQGVKKDNRKTSTRNLRIENRISMRKKITQDGRPYFGHGKCMLHLDGRKLKISQSKIRKTGLGI